MTRPLGEQTVVVSTHYATSGPSDALEDYLRPRVGRTVAISHAFQYAKVVESILRVTERSGAVAASRIPWSPRVPEPITWAKDLVLSLWWTLRVPGKVDHFVGIDPLNALAGLAARRLGKVRRVTFWTIDYVPNRFPNGALNRAYHWVDALCTRRCDETWNVSPRMAEARRQRGLTGPQRLVPMGAYANPHAVATEPHRAVHMGSLLEKQGLQKCIEAMPSVRARVPDATLLVIGDGDYRPQLEALVEELGLGDVVAFLGYVDDHSQLERLIGESAVGLATYDPRIGDYSYFADPGKIKNYLAAGVPVVATAVPWSADWAAAAGAGRIVDYDAEAIADAIVELFGDREARQAACRLAREVDWSSIFDEAFDQSPEPVNARA